MDSVGKCYYFISFWGETEHSIACINIQGLIYLQDTLPAEVQVLVLLASQVILYG